MGVHIITMSLFHPLSATKAGAFLVQHIFISIKGCIFSETTGNSLRRGGGVLPEMRLLFWGGGYM